MSDLCITPSGGDGIGCDVVEIFARQTRDQRKGGGMAASQRIEKLQRLRTAIERHAEAAYAALADDIGKPMAEAMGDHFAPIAEADYAIAQLEGWMQPQEIAIGPGASPGTRAFIRHEPKGRVLIFGPWNYPFALTLQPLVAAIAAGNSCIIKPSELTPVTSALVARIVSECFDENEVAVIQGGPDVANALLELPFDHIFFTGSGAIGRLVMAAAARHLATVTLELGGKSPVVIGDDADIVRAAQAVVEGKFGNAGQVCIAPDHVWIPARHLDAFVDAAANHVRQLFYCDGEFQQERLSKVINDRQVGRLRRLLDDASARGAKIRQGGAIAGLHIEPTIIIDVPRDALIMQEEIFGPILPVLTYQGPDDAIEQITRQGKPLALYIFAENEGFVEAILNGTSSGGVTVNGVMLHAIEPMLPFGGVGASGMGAYHGPHSFRELTHRRSVYHQGTAHHERDISEKAIPA